MTGRIVFVHGAFHGASCWEEVEAALRRLGHETLAVDLPIEEIDAGPDEYAAVVAAALGDGAPAWLVGHSMAGTVVTRVALEREVAGLILLCAGLPPTSEAEHAENLAAFSPAVGEALHADAQGMIRIAPEDALRVFYHDVPRELADREAARLRPQWAGGISTSYAPIARLPDVPTHVLLARDDRILPFEFSADLARRRFGVEPVALEGGHSPFLSQPEALARLIDALVAGEAPTS
ncbi:MAG: alpha/beta fold hydrolase [Alphaproteobacteria bacterium]|nr:alpha/beta fold hydrolase [Alphaproteobacteria bacterium]